MSAYLFTVLCDYICDIVYIKCSIKMVKEKRERLSWINWALQKEEKESSWHISSLKKNLNKVRMG